MDGHLLLYAFIPPLVFGDAMNLDFNILKNCVSQCATLAFPGVAIGAALFAIVVQYVIPSTGHWTWDLSMAFGAVMSATDPVAVVALLKQLGAPDSLTMIIGGESLLNDGMAMILWAVTHCPLHTHTHPLPPCPPPPPPPPPRPPPPSPPPSPSPPSPPLPLPPPPSLPPSPSRPHRHRPRRRRRRLHHRRHCRPHPMHPASPCEHTAHN